ncbi:APC family permease [Anatilimnocola floriformis]|uniref:APC family permease n=1 Tax=Anatilimnocola floriformis TaxID=2948575 RepID=UPI0020C35E67|nr:amino acid permease [Anatilimnocola floriformis]
MTKPAQQPLLDPDVQTLPRVLGRFDAITVVIGSIIGSGIFLKAQPVAAQLGSFGPIMAIWIIVGLVTLCGALALAELAAMLPQAGGPYVYLREAYGRLPAFLWGWTEFWIIRTGSLGALACATVLYGDELLNSLKLSDYLPDWLAVHVPLSHGMQAMCALLLTFIVSIINVIGTRWAAWVQNVTSVVKVAFLIFLIVAPFVLLKADVKNLEPIMPANVSLNFWRAMGVAMILVFWPYDGWINIGPVAEEVREPQKNVPIALTVGVMIVIIVYLGANACYHLVLPMSAVAAKDTKVASEVSFQLLGTGGRWLASACVMISAFGALNSNLLAGPRIYFAMARDKLFPAAIRKVHPRFQTPANAVLAQMAWSLVLIIGAYAWTAPSATPAEPVVTTAVDEAAPTEPPTFSLTNWFKAAFIPKNKGPAEAFDALTAFVIFGGQIFYAMAVGAVFVLRRKMPDRPRPYKTWGYPITPAFYLLVFAAALVSLLLDYLPQTAAGSLLILAGVVVYFLVAKPETSTAP